jgi:hypothetical protein
MRMAEACMKHLGFPINDTQAKRMSQIILKHYESATKTWGDAIARCDAEERSPVTDAEAPDALDALASWLEDVKLNEGGDDAYTPTSSNSHARSEGGPNRPQLYRCANCGNPSAVLRKCSQCAQVRYCNQEYVLFPIFSRQFLSYLNALSIEHVQVSNSPLVRT